MRAFLSLLETKAVEGMVSMAEIQRVADAVTGAEGALSTYYDRYSASCEVVFDLVKAERQRRDFLGRVLTQPFFVLLDDPDSGVARKNLPHYFAAVRMILGDDVFNAYQLDCTALAHEVQDADEMVDWDRFYAHPRIQQILEETLVAIAHSFRRFEPRKDWFLIVMNNDPRAVSLGSTMFLPKNADAKLEHEFNEGCFVRLFKALFAVVRPANFDKVRRTAFQARFRDMPEVLFGPLFVELEALSQQKATPATAARGRGIETRDSGRDSGKAKKKK